MKPKLLLVALLTYGAATAQTGKPLPANTTKEFNQLSIQDKMLAMKQMPLQLLKQQADSICTAHKLVLKDAKDQPVDIAKAIAENKILVENGVVFYLPNGFPSPVAKKETNPLNTKN
ncbi:MAG: hypothetical protein ABIX01_06455 [Chitinophagaceae bacterium]